MPPSPPSPSHTSSSHDPEALLEAVLLALEHTDAALRVPDPQDLPEQAQALARSLAVFHAAFQQLKDPAAADWYPRLALVGSRLMAIQEALAARSGAAHRALSTLFPAEQANAYARMGRPGAPRSGLPRVSNNTSLKA